MSILHLDILHYDSDYISYAEYQYRLRVSSFFYIAQPPVERISIKRSMVQHAKLSNSLAVQCRGASLGRLLATIRHWVLLTADRLNHHSQVEAPTLVHMSISGSRSERVRTCYERRLSSPTIESMRGDPPEGRIHSIMVPSPRGRGFTRLG